MSKTVQEMMFTAKVAEQASRWDDFNQLLVEAVHDSPKDLTAEERNVFSHAFKQVIGKRRVALKAIRSMAKEEEEYGATGKVHLVSPYQKKVEEELDALCDLGIDLLRKHLLQKVSGQEAKVYYVKMRGDLHRYKSEFGDDGKKRDEMHEAEKAYEKATAEANELEPTNTVRLAVSLNYAVFMMEVKRQTEKAIEVAKKGFDEASVELDKLSADAYKDTTLFMQLLRDNMVLWAKEDDD